MAYNEFTATIDLTFHDDTPAHAQQKLKLIYDYLQRMVKSVQINAGSPTKLP